jgi:hypothetical protein
VGHVSVGVDQLDAHMRTGRDAYRGVGRPGDAERLAGMAGEASTTRLTFPVVKVMVRAARSMLAPAGAWLPRR